MSNFLLEIGTEELPADFARLVVPQLEELVRNDLQEHRIEFQEIKCSSTPRRLLVCINNLADHSNDLIEERKGPPASRAFENGAPTVSAIGFAKRYGISVTDLVIKETSKGAFVFGKTIKKGETAFDLLAQLIPKWINNIQGRRFMRWGVGDIRFSRPIRWIVALIDEREISISLPDSDPKVFSGRISRGHRLFKELVTINSSEDYSSKMRKVGVIVDRKERSKFIQKIVQEYSLANNCEVNLSNTLINELTDLVESPSLIQGGFDKSFLELPQEVLSTVMQVHQRYIPVYRKNAVMNPLALDAKEILTPTFLCISNGLPKSNKIIREGNERVLKARFADAKFFINTDLSSTSSVRRDQLKKVTFADGLGSLFDRVKRIEWLVDLFESKFKISDVNFSHLRQAAYFSKHDLVSQMVGEFPELQGVMGGKYLLAEGKSKDVALAVMEHYLPRGYGDKLPESAAGSALALLDRLELLLSIFSKGERPTGSSDPYALRRAGNAILQITWNQKWQINLFDLIFTSTKYWIELFPDFKINTENLFNDLLAFFHQRIIALLEEFGFDIDLVQSVAGETVSIERLMKDPIDVLNRLSLLTQMRKGKSLVGVQLVVNRASKLATKSTLPSNVVSCDNFVDPNLFEKDSERAMLEIIKALEPIAKSSSPDKYEKLANGLASGSNVLSQFFDGDQSVMVMTDNEDVRKNRLNLLSILVNQAQQIADFNLIVQ
ncbi:glycine--tRNA ligase subunit beta [Prochlorococcus marinus]|uniref:glycine--tRNA ligase subunit beta n=1 Tax=Prochlorococcus marinus TaxID=1219 RepID=UPI0022B32794|nr:glycine--tRNA ligase subunit beta [Prochlorococcus marinus]